MTNVKVTHVTFTQILYRYPKVKHWLISVQIYAM